MKRALLVVIGLTLAACAPSADMNGALDSPAQSSRARCFDVDRVSNFSSGERNGTLYVRSRGADRAVFEISGPGCWDVGNAIQLGLRTTGFGSSRACEGDPVEIITPQGGGGRPGVCRAYVVRALTEAEFEALPSRSQPN